MQRLLWFTGSSGLDMEIDSVRHKYDPEVGVAPARIAVNVDYDRSGRISRRKGWQYTAVTANSHSLFCDGGECLFVTGDALCKLSDDMTYTELRNVTTGARMCYQQVGSRIYYTNGRESGFVLGGTSYSWEKPATVYQVKDSTRVYTGPAAGTGLTYYNGRMCITQGNLVWYSDPYDVNLYEKTAYLPFESDVTMCRAVTNGLWIGTRDRLVFLRGENLKTPRYEKKGLLGVFKGTDCYVNAIDFSDGRLEGVGVIFCTKKGPFLGTADGNLIPLADKKLRLPDVTIGAGVVVGRRYIASLGSDDTKLTVTAQLETTAVSQYLNYNFNSYCQLGGYYYGANGNGIFKLDATEKDESTSESKAAIAAKYESGPTDFGARTEKRIAKCVIANEANGLVYFTVKVCEGTDNQVAIGSLPFYTDNRQHVDEVPIGRDLKGRYFSFIIENKDGADFSIDEIVAYVRMLLRKPEKEGAN